jgi:glycerol-3-phosphate dehydrogenase
VIEHLGASYGTLADSILDMVEQNATLGTRLIADLPYIRAEVIHACRQEMAMTPLDMLARRMSITLEDRHQGLGIVADVTALMADELGWSAEQQSAMLAAFRAKIEGERAARQVQIPTTAVHSPKEGEVSHEKAD